MGGPDARSTTATPCGRRVAQVAHEPTRPDPLPPMPRDPAPCGRHAVQVLRTYPAQRPPYPFAPEGERSIARAYLKAFRRAERLDLPRGPVPLVRGRRRRTGRGAPPRTPAAARRGRSPLPGPRRRVQRTAVPHRAAARARARLRRRRRPGRRVRPRERAWPADLRARQGLHHRRRVDDGRLRQPQPSLVDARLGAVVRRARRRARRARAARPGRPRRRRAPARPRRRGCDCGASTSVATPTTTPTSSTSTAAFDALRRRRDALDAWHEGRRRGPRPAGRLRVHRPEQVPEYHAWWANAVYRMLVDPDGRPTAQRRRQRY